MIHVYWGVLLLSMCWKCLIIILRIWAWSGILLSSGSKLSRATPAQPTHAKERTGPPEAVSVIPLWNFYELQLGSITNCSSVLTISVLFWHLIKWELKKTADFEVWVAIDVDHQQSRGTWTQHTHSFRFFRVGSSDAGLFQTRTQVEGAGNVNSLGAKSCGKAHNLGM